MRKERPKRWHMCKIYCSLTHREKVTWLNSQFLQQKQQVVRAREIEECHLHVRHQLAKRQLKDMFFVQWH